MAAERLEVHRLCAFTRLGRFAGDKCIDRRKQKIERAQRILRTAEFRDVVGLFAQSCLVLRENWDVKRAQQSFFDQRWRDALWRREVRERAHDILGLRHEEHRDRELQAVFALKRDLAS